MRTLGNLVDCGLVFSLEGQMSKVTWLKSDCLSMPVVLQHINIHQIMLLYAAKMHADSYWTLIGVIYCPIVYLCAVYQDHILCCMCESAGKHQSTNQPVFLYYLLTHLLTKHCCGWMWTQQSPGCPLVKESHGIQEDHFPGLESHGKQQRSWKVMENDDNVMEFLLLH